MSDGLKNRFMERIAGLKAELQMAHENADAALAEKDTRIAELGALVAKYKWQRDEAIADGPGYFPRDTLERRWAERETT